METITKNIPALALRGLTVFPRMTASFDVEREISMRALERAMETGQEIFLVTQRELGVDVAFFAFERGNFLLELFDPQPLFRLGGAFFLCSVASVLRFRGGGERGLFFRLLRLFCGGLTGVVFLVRALELGNFSVRKLYDFSR